MAKRDLLEIENARIIWPNFEGRPTDFRPQGGYRNFNILLDSEQAQQLSNDGWNVKIKPPREEGDDPRCTLEVSVRFDNFPPKIYMITTRNKVELTEDTVGVLDDSDIISADLIISPYNYEVNGKSGIKAYLKTAYITIQEDRFAEKYDM